MSDEHEHGDNGTNGRIADALVRVAVGCLTIAIVGLFTWIWHTSAQVLLNKVAIENSIRPLADLNQLRTDVEVVRSQQLALGRDLEEIKQILREITAVGRPDVRSR